MCFSPKPRPTPPYRWGGWREWGGPESPKMASVAPAARMTRTNRMWLKMKQSHRVARVEGFGLTPLGFLLKPTPVHVIL